MIDWCQAALNIQQHMPLVQASKKIGKNPEYMGRYARLDCDEPKFSDGLKWLNLHLDLCGEIKHKKLLTMNTH
jgi:hypothetical protein